MKNNFNMRDNGDISKFDSYGKRKYKRYAKQTLKLFNKKFNCNVTNRGLWLEETFVCVLQDTHKKGEEYTKRIQGDIVSNGLSYLGLYGVKDARGVVRDIVGVIWTRKELYAEGSLNNPGIKVDLHHIQDCFNHNKVVYALEKMYKSVVVPFEEIMEYISMSNSLSLDFSEYETEEQIYHKVTHDTRNATLQKKFKDSLKTRGIKCELCDIGEIRLLIASHIWPVSKIVKEESLKNAEKVKHYVSPDNGLLLCPNHDALFDKQFITFDDDGQIVISSIIEGMNDLLNLDRNIKIPIDGGKEFYMKKHRTLFYIQHPEGENEN